MISPCRFGVEVSTVNSQICRAVNNKIDLLNADKIKLYTCLSNRFVLGLCLQKILIRTKIEMRNQWQGRAF